MVDVALRLAPGPGRLVRRPRALLWSATADRGLVESFAAAPDGGELQALASATIAAGFAVGPFIGLEWDGPLRVMAFGDATVRTDQPSLPALNGAGSRTWVEHTLAITGPVRIEVGGEAIDAATDLVAGAVPAGGFRLELGQMSEVPATPSTVEPVAPAVSGSDDTAAIPVGLTDDPFAVAPLGPPGLAAALTEPPRDASGGPPDAAAPEATDVDATLPPPAAEILLADVRRDRTADGRGSLVDAKVCVKGHANAPTAATCAVCAELLPPGAGVVHVPRPSLGRLLLDDGELVELDQELLIGRRPGGDGEPVGLQRITTLGEKVSRRHLEVRFQGWDILVADLGSTNGTFVVAHPGGDVVALEPGRPQLIDPGAVVYFGSRSFRLLGRRSEDDE